ncbi:MAG: hypothetical protein QM758_23490 [Armatimonas sp.]
MKKRISLVALAALGLTSVAPVSAQSIDLEKLGKEALKGIVVGAAVKATAGQINDLLNSAAGKHGGKIGQITKVVPIVSVGERGYAGAAQIAGPKDYVRQVQAVVQLESTKKIGSNLWRVKALVPSNSINPGKIKRVDKVGLSALIDVALDGKPSTGSAMRGLTGVDVLKGAALGALVNANRKSLDTFAREVTLARDAAPTRVAVSGSIGSKAFIGAAQVAGSSLVLPKVQAVWQWDTTLDRGRIRVRYLIPSNSLNPLKTTRLDGVGITALLETSVQSVASDKNSRPTGRGENGRAARDREGRERDDDRRDGRGIPPGLAKKGGIPPGLAKKGGLPPGQAKKHDRD